MAVEKDKYRIEINKNRSDNRNLFENYVLSEARIKEILLSLTVDDFSERRKKAFIIRCHRSHVNPFTRPKNDFFV